MELKASQHAGLHKLRKLTTEDVVSCPTHIAGKNVSSPDSNTSLGS